MMKIVFCICLAVAAAVPVHYEQHEYYAPKYSYKYYVQDHHTDDIKSQWETRDGDKVKGSYRLIEPDGAVRIVDYVSDGHNGFRAIVTREKDGHKEVTVHGNADAGDIDVSYNEVASDDEGNYGGQYESQGAGGGSYYARGAGYGDEGDY